jgi:hypothetical protein
MDCAAGTERSGDTAVGTRTSTCTVGAHTGVTREEEEGCYTGQTNRVLHGSLTQLRCN